MVWWGFHHYPHLEQVQDLRHISMGYKMKLYFQTNPYFTNMVIVKEFQCNRSGKRPSQGKPWEPSHNLPLSSALSIASFSPRPAGISLHPNPLASWPGTPGRPAQEPGHQPQLLQLVLKPQPPRGQQDCRGGAPPPALPEKTLLGLPLGTWGIGGVLWALY